LGAPLLDEEVKTRWHGALLLDKGSIFSVL
jgi:hypothetical protein